MYKETITYTDYNGMTRTEEFFFNLTKAEIMDMQLSVNGGLSEMLKRLIASNDTPMIIKTFKDLVFKAYGVKSDDGRRFIKSDELSIEFSQTEAYSQFYMKLAFDATAATEFVKGIIPADMASKIETTDVVANA